MSTTEPKPRTYRASVNQRFLDKVDRVFDATPLTVFGELLQNSRRAGATEVTIHTEPKGFIYHDNGAGIEDPSILLDLAGSGWQGEIDNPEDENYEDPAGMGFFSLSAAASVNVASGGWALDLDPDVFRGRKDAPVITLKRNVKGVKITVLWGGMDTSAFWRDARQAAGFCGIDKVVLTRAGMDEEHILPSDFLAGADFIREVPELGCRIGVCLAGKDFDFYIHRGRTTHLNFKGVLLEHRFESTQKAYNSGYGAQFRVDVLNSRHLNLVLPARNALSITPSVARLGEELERTFYKVMAQLHCGNHTLPFKMYERARELGVDVGYAAPRLRTAASLTRRGTDPWTDVSDPSTVLRVGVEDWLHHWHDFSYNDTESLPDLAYDESSYEGYPWYDAIPVIHEAVVVADGEAVPHPDEEDEVSQFVRAYDNLRIILKCTDGKEHTADSGLVIRGDLCGHYLNDWESCQVMVARDKDGDIPHAGDIARCVAEQMFSESEDYESDSTETQEDNFVEEVTRWVEDELQTPASAALGRLKRWTDENHNYPYNHTWKVSHAPGYHVPKVEVAEHDMDAWMRSTFLDAVRAVAIKHRILVRVYNWGWAIREEGGSWTLLGDSPHPAAPTLSTLSLLAEDFMMGSEEIVVGIEPTAVDNGGEDSDEA